MRVLELQSAESLKVHIQSYFNKNEEARFIHRLHGILMKIDKKEAACEVIANLFGHSPRTISNWINKVNEAQNIEVLRDVKKPGRSPKLNTEELKILKEVLQKEPENSGIAANIWDGKSLSFYIEKEFHITLGVRQCQRLFKKLGFSLKRARPVVAKGDPIKKEAFKKTSREKTKR
jgi:transposase